VPRITYFVESRREAARRGYSSRHAFLADEVLTPALLERLAQTGSAVALAAHAHEPGVAPLLRRLDAHGVPADLWLNLALDDGYWLSLATLDAAEHTLEATLSWLHTERLPVRRLGLDLEPPHPVAAALTARRPALLASRLAGLRGSLRPQAQFERLLRTALAAYPVDLYTLPVAQDVAPLRALLGLPRLPTELPADGSLRVVRMLYSSLAPVGPASFVARQHRTGTVPALGIVSRDNVNPGIELPGPGGRAGAAELLKPAELRRDLAQVVQAACPELFVFALNGAEVLDLVEGGLREALGAGGE